MYISTEKILSVDHLPPKWNDMQLIIDLIILIIFFYSNYFDYLDYLNYFFISIILVILIIVIVLTFNYLIIEACPSCLP